MASTSPYPDPDADADADADANHVRSVAMGPMEDIVESMPN